MVAHVIAPDLVRAVGETLGVRFVGRAQEQERRGQCAAGNDDDVGGVDLLLPVSSHVHGVHGASRRIGAELRCVSAREERDVRVS